MTISYNVTIHFGALSELHIITVCANERNPQGAAIREALKITAREPTHIECN